MSLERSLAVDFRAGNNRKRFATFAHRPADVPGNRRAIGITKKIATDLSIKCESVAASGEAAADLAAGIQIQGLVPDHHVALDRTGKSHIVRPRAQIPVHHAADAYRLRE